MSFDSINRFLKKHMRYDNGYSIIAFIVLFGTVILFDKRFTGKFIGSNGFLLSFNIILYLSVLHLVFVYSVKPKNKKYIDSLKDVSKTQNVDIISEESKIDNSIQRVFFGSLFVVCSIFAIYVFKMSNQMKTSQIKFLMLICLTVCSELFLVFQVFDKPVDYPCSSIQETYIKKKHLGIETSG